MKKLLSIVFLCAVLTATGANEKEIVANNFENVEVEKCDFQQEISNEEMFSGCGEQGNREYDKFIRAGYNHRQARSFRRAFVRECRGFGPNGWLGIYIGLIGHCD